MTEFDLRSYGIQVPRVCRNFPPSKLYTEAIHHERGSRISDRGALIAYSGAKTGRSPKDKRIVSDARSKDDIWWGAVNVPIEPAAFAANRELAVNFLNTRDMLYCVDGFAGWDPAHRLKIRVICARPYHALFIYQMLIRPSPAELAAFGKPDYVIYNAGEFPANRHVPGITSSTSVSLSFEEGEMVILGTEYAGEMKKGVFTIMNYLMPKRGVLSMHCSATAERHDGSSTLLFGLSGTGKTTLSADPKRLLVGDDEHCWTESGVFNIEGGCYAKAINLSEESEPDIFRALRFGAVLENVEVNDVDHSVVFSSSRITENTRGAYPIEYIPNAKIPCVAGHPRHIIFLTCDAFGVLPPVSRLSPEHAMYHFISGYTAKVAGTEVGVTEPQATFSPCFGGPFLVLHPARYAEMLAERMKKHQAKVWLVNTGWSGGGYGVGARVKLSYTRAIIDAIHAGSLAGVRTVRDATFGFDTIAECPNVPADILTPRNVWKDKSGYDAGARKLAGLFVENFKKYEVGASPEVRAAGPRA
ncbi:MAG: Phosphoenolpyruvate carboxykinase (ATP) [Phycisphaerae bacterium]|nr:Phosphoenolpyruvate carboxykinase (ATP) [Phycisphaerae bacterium]